MINRWLVVCVIFVAQHAMAQITLTEKAPEIPNVKAPYFEARWSKDSAKIGDTIELIFTAPVPTYTHVFSEKSTCAEDDGPLRASIDFEENAYVKLIGKPIGVGDTLVKDEIFGCATGQFNKTVVFKQKLVILKPIGHFHAFVSIQACMNEEAGGACFNFKKILTEIPEILVK